MSLVFAFLALFVLTFFWLASHPPALEKWFPFIVLFTVSASMVALVLAFLALLRRYTGRGYAVGGALLALGAMLVTAREQFKGPEFALRRPGD